MSRYVLSAILVVAIFLPLTATATVEITPMAGYRFGGNLEDQDGVNVNLKSGATGAVAIDFDYERDTQIELFWSRQTTTLDDNPGFPRFDLDIDYIHLGGTILFPGEFDFIPYGAGGAGVTIFTPDQADFGSETRFSVSLGGGIKYFPVKHVGLRLEGRGYVTWFPESGALFCSDNTCTTYLEGDAMFQFEGLAGVIVRF
jgi:opacity protein-like surface antigen